ncbi:MAG: hypothetical protein QM813_23530 [Verrucomicrobiota bacterium]
MTNDVFPTAMIPTMVRDLSVTDLIRTAETLKSSGQNGSVVQLYAAWVQANATHPLLYAGTVQLLGGVDGGWCFDRGARCIAAGVED